MVTHSVGLSYPSTPNLVYENRRKWVNRRRQKNSGVVGLLDHLPLLPMALEVEVGINKGLDGSGFTYFQMVGTRGRASCRPKYSLVKEIDNNGDDNSTDAAAGHISSSDYPVGKFTFS